MRKITRTIIKRMLPLLLSIFMCLGVFSPLSVCANDLTSHLPAYGTINGDGVCGFTTNYVCYGGEAEVQHKVQNGWHVTLKNSYYSHDVMWFECWDSDDGDYYGWIDVQYINVTSSSNNDYYNEPITSVQSISPRKGEISGNGVYGYTDNYVVYGAAQETEHKVQNAWHITAENKCTSYGINWYQCWDSDDGDYYGWIDEKYLYFYDTKPAAITKAPAKTTETVKTVVVEKTVIVTQYVTQTEITSAETSASTTAASIEIVEAIGSANTNDSGGINNGTILLVMIGIVILLLIILTALFIFLYTKKMKSDMQNRKF